MYVLGVFFGKHGVGIRPCPRSAPRKVAPSPGAPVELAAPRVGVDVRRAQERTLLEQLDALEVSDEERAAILVMALVRRSRALRTRAVSLVGGRGCGGVLRRSEGQPGPLLPLPRRRRR